MATMFTEADVKNILNLFPPQNTPDFLPSLTLASSGNGFVTLQFVQAQFRSRVAKGRRQLLTHRKYLLISSDSQRISTFALANEIDVDEQLVVKLVRSHPKLALLSADGKSIITADERDVLHEKIKSLVSSALLSKADFASQNDIDMKSLEILLSDQEEEVLSIEGYVCNKAYESRISKTILGMLKQALEDVA
jgi:hypothetical protein